MIKLHGATEAEVEAFDQLLGRLNPSPFRISKPGDVIDHHLVILNRGVDLETVPGNYLLANVPSVSNVRITAQCIISGYLRWLQNRLDTRHSRERVAGTDSGPIWKS